LGTAASTPDGSPDGAYEQLSYPGFAYAHTHPARVEVLARLFGLSPAPAGACRVLEVGCGDGGNVLSMAQTLPGSTFTGIDLAAGGIARGNELAAAAGLDNVALRAEDIERLPADLGPFDYIVAHGVYSWIPPRARGALLQCCGERLAPHGVAYVSYNAYPGSYLRDMTRDILLYHLRDVEGADARLASVHELLETMTAIPEPSPFARVLREQMQRMLSFSDALLFHDDIAEISTPFYFHEFMEHAAGHGLRFLSEADLSESQMRDMPDSAATLMARLPADVVVHEQYMDFFKNRMFRQTLLCHAEAPAHRELHDEELERLAIASAARPQEREPGSESEDPLEETFAVPDGVTMTTSEPHVRAALHALAEAWPAALDFPMLVERALEAAQAPLSVDSETPPSDAQVADRLRAVMLEAYVAGAVQLLSVAPPVAARPGERPLASALARAQCAAGAEVVSSLLHANVHLEGDLERLLLGLLDGTRDRRALAQAIGLGVDEVRAGLEHLAQLGVLEAARPAQPSVSE
jgi:SAM-dependent methyltransferase